MEDVIEQLEAVNQSVPIPLEPASDDDILNAEEAILLPLPAEYKHFLETVSHIIYGRIEPCTVSDSSSHTYLPEVTANAWDIGIPRDVFVICEAQEGYYCMDDKGQIGLWHNGQFNQETWDSIWQWAKDIWLSNH